MSATRIYYTDSACLAFTSTVVERSDDGGTALVVLAETAFYPTTGGQPHDTGTLAGVRVVDVFDDEQGRVVHRLEAGLDSHLAAGANVEGRIDAVRRRDHMQQHSGQHVLSAAFNRLHGVPTESFHLGATATTIDLAREVTADEIASAEAAANRVVWENRPVAIRFVTADEAAAMPLRKEPVRGGTLRLIEIEDFDLSACGGTHVAQTGEIGMIVVKGWERFKGGSRLTFAGGGRALDAFHELRDAVSAATRHLSVLPHELSGSVERALGENRDIRRQLRGMTEQLARYHARDLAAQARHIGGIGVVVQAVPGYDAAGLKALASAIVAPSTHVAVLFTAERPSLVVASRSTDVSLDAAGIIKRLIGQFGGKGGGKPDLAQGGGLDAPTSEIIATAEAAVTEMLGGSAPGR